MKEHLSFLFKVIDLAKFSISHHGGPFAALVVKEGKIISQAYNHVTEHHDPTAHAEIVAIREACQTLTTHELKDCTLYASSEPCPMCLSAIYWAHLPTVYYINSCDQAKAVGFDDSFIFDELKLAHHEKQIKIIKEEDHLIRLHGAEIFKLWEKNKDRIDY